MYVSFNFNYALFPKPRGQQSGKGGHIYHRSTQYVNYQNLLISSFRSSLSTFSLPDQFLLGFFNGYYKNPKGKQPDLDNLEGGILDSLIASGLLKDDNRENFIGGYKRCYKIGKENSLIIICTEDQEDQMIAEIKARLLLAKQQVRLSQLNGAKK